MFRRLLLGSIAAVAFAFPTGLSAQKAEYGTAEEAKAMLDKVVAAMKAGMATTLAQISKGEGGFKDRDLYPACIGPDGKIAAHPDPARIGLAEKDVKDSTGKLYGQEILKAAEGKILEVSYMFPRPGTDKTPKQKISLVTKTGDYICFVGYYK
jgi:hypothetical protein